MNKKDLYEILCGFVPVKSNDKEDFRATVNKRLREYINIIKKLDATERPDNWGEIFKRVNQLVEGINRAIRFEYQGVRHSAYIAIKHQLDGYVSNTTQISRLAYNDNILTIPSGTVTYRMRKMDMEEQGDLKRKDLFHIPLDKKGLVKTQRFSVPGYPCLYLSHSLYGSWEEMGRPNFGTVMVSKFKSKRDFNVLDLRFPSAKAWEQNISKCILFFPLIIACMVQVKNHKDFYKPEYLIPQLLTEWIISQNSNRENPNEPEIIGVLYTSSQKSKDFDFPLESYDNFAIPVLKPFKSKKYCVRLSALFELTKPTYYDLEVLRQGEINERPNFEVNNGVLQFLKFKSSQFGKMEQYLENEEFGDVEKE